MSGTPKTRPEARELLAKVKQRLTQLDRQYPGERPIASALAQLGFVEPYLASDADRMPRLKSINFGLLGVRFIREFDEDLSRDLADLDEYVVTSFQPGEP